MIITRLRIISALLQDTWIRVFCIVGLDSATNLLVCGGNHLQWKPSFFHFKSVSISFSRWIHFKAKIWDNRYLIIIKNYVSLLFTAKFSISTLKFSPQDD